MFKIIDSKTGKQVGGLYKEGSRARQQRDKLDLKYGAIRYRVVRVDMAAA